MVKQLAIIPTIQFFEQLKICFCRSLLRVSVAIGPGPGEKCRSRGGYDAAGSVIGSMEGVRV